MRWDVFAAVVALAGIPLMLAPGTTWLLKVILRKILRLIFVNGSTCECLEWTDIPEGPLHDPGIHEPLLNYPGSHEDLCYTGQYFQHDENNCFKSTIGAVFQRAWVSPYRRDRRVTKPFQLDIKKAYIRTDPKTLKVYAMFSNSANYGNNTTVKFVERGGILVAHLTVNGGRLGSYRGFLANRTKREVELILRGYPPFFKTRIQTSESSDITSPISSPEDITRGGWIVAIGLDHYDSVPLYTHNMEDSMGLFNKEQYEDAPWTNTIMAYSVRRFGQTLKNLQSTFVGDAIVEEAVTFYTGLLKGDISLDATRPLARAFGAFKMSHPFGHSVWVDKPYINLLSSSQWQVAMNTFNHSEPITDEEKLLFQEFMSPIFLAAFVGLLHVLLYGNHYRNPKHVYKLPEFPELDGRKYVYLTTCDVEGD